MSFWPRTRNVTLGRPTLIFFAGTNSSLSSESTFESDVPSLLVRDTRCSPNLYKCFSFNFDKRFFCLTLSFLLSSGDRCKLMRAIFISCRNFSGSGHGRRGTGRFTSFNGGVVDDCLATMGGVRLRSMASMTASLTSSDSVRTISWITAAVDTSRLGLRSLSLSKCSLLFDNRALFCNSKP